MGSIAKELNRLRLSFKFAVAGLAHAIKKERNLQIHLSVAALVILFGFFFSIEKMEWLIILLCIGIVISLELVNTAIERTVDLITAEYKPLAKQAKDIAAGAVFVFSVISVMIGLIIFGRQVLALFQF